ncbi:J domain-containing protein [Synechococcus sp. CCY 9618]|uniref:J domain-containing protein n=1 Tax=Synechococcus sp. CCY 9618 TaxID=2815602 RepID=UPI001C234F6C|nr:J domain-containing protein [Synechococcus sp. CCY 9618]
MSASATPPTPNHYQVLQLKLGATDQELRQAFRGLSKRYHPDTTTLPAAEAEVAFRQLRQAYAVLSDPAARRIYDAALRQPVGAAPVRLPQPVVVSRPVPVRRALSGGEWFALLLLAVALVLSLVLGIGVAWARGAEMMAWPSWWAELEQASAPPVPFPSKATPEPQESAPLASAPEVG